MAKRGWEYLNIFVDVISRDVLMRIENSKAQLYMAGWCFGTFVIFPYIGNNNP
jgi:hypothetical protein